MMQHLNLIHASQLHSEGAEVEKKPMFVYRDGKVYLADENGNPAVTFIGMKARVDAAVLRILGFPATAEQTGLSFRVCLDETCTVSQAAKALSGEVVLVEPAHVISFPPHDFENIQVINN